MSNLNVENLENHLVRVTAIVPVEKFEEGINFAYNNKKSEIAIDGFRKGKVPKQIVEKTYGKNFFYQDAIEHVFPELYEQALKENDIFPVSHPTLETPVIEETEVKISALVFKKPEIVIENYKGVEFEKVNTEITDEDVDAEIQKELENNARVVAKDVNSPIEDGDIVKIDFIGYTEDGVAFEGGTANDYSIEIGSKTFIDTFEEQLVGKKVSEETDVNVTFPETYQNAELAGKPALFKVVIKEVSNKEYPELDDEFAATVSEFETLDEYKADLLNKLQETRKKAAEVEEENRIIEKLIADADLDIPQVMVDNRINQMIEGFSGQMQQQGIKLDDYLGLMGQSMESLKQMYAPEAKIQVHARLVLEAVGKAEQFEISEEEIEESIVRIAKSYNMEADQLKAVMRPEDKDGIKEDILTQKALKFIIDNAKEV